MQYGIDMEAVAIFCAGRLSTGMAPAFYVNAALFVKTDETSYAIRCPQRITNEMSTITLSDELRRFIHSIASVPHLEAILLLHELPAQAWDEGIVGRRLYVNDGQVTIVLNELCNAGICARTPDSPGRFIYAPASAELHELIGQLAHYYPQHLIEVTNMIHSKGTSGQRVRQFADAFKIRKDK